MKIAPPVLPPAIDGSVAQRFNGPCGATAIASRAALVSFFTLSFTWSWSLWLVSAAVRPTSSVAASMLSVAASFGPSLVAAAVVLSSAGPGEFRRWLKRCLQWKVGWRWMALAFLLPLAIMSGVVLGQVALGGILVSSPARGQLLMVPAVFVAVFFAGGPLGEEFGWRGYALPEMQKCHGWRIASLVIGALWGVWHVPLFYLVGTSDRTPPWRAR